jgi:hypothetical protein
MNAPPPGYLTLRDFADLRGVTYQGVYIAIREGRVKAVRDDGHWFVLASEECGAFACTCRYCGGAFTAFARHAVICPREACYKRYQTDRNRAGNQSRKRPAEEGRS